MKKLNLNIIIAAGLTLASASVRADLANYQATINGQNPNNYFNLDNSLSPSAGSGTLTVGGSAIFGSDYYGNANDAASFPATSDFLNGSASILNGAGIATAVGTLSLLFYVPATIPATGYYFSDSETTGSAANGQAANSAFALQFSGSALTLKIGNKSYAAPTTVTASTWYYLALTYNLNGSVTSVNGINYYLGAVGGTLSSVFEQKGGTGNLSTSSTLGDGLAFVVGNKQAAVVGTTSTAGVAGGGIDELATWNTALSSSQIGDQFSALTATPAPEPSSLALIGGGAVLLLAMRRKNHHRFS